MTTHAEAPIAASREAPGLRRLLGVTDLTLIAMGTVIGSGIYLVPAVVLRQTGGASGPAMLVWLAAGILSLLGALTYAEMGAMKPEAGGLYVYVRDTFGALPAFLYGWTSFFVIASGSTATLAVAFSGYLTEFVPLSPVVARLVSIAMIALIAWLNVRGTRKSATVQNWTTGAKVLSLLMLHGRGDDRRVVGVRGVAVRHLLRRRDARRAADLSARDHDRDGRTRRAVPPRECRLSRRARP